MAPKGRGLAQLSAAAAANAAVQPPSHRATSRAGSVVSRSSTQSKQRCRCIFKGCDGSKAIPERTARYHAQKDEELRLKKEADKQAAAPSAAAAGTRPAKRSRTVAGLDDSSACPSDWSQHDAASASPAAAAAGIASAAAVAPPPMFHFDDHPPESSDSESDVDVEMAPPDDEPPPAAIPLEPTGADAGADAGTSAAAGAHGDSSADATLGAAAPSTPFVADFDLGPKPTTAPPRLGVPIIFRQQFRPVSIGETVGEFVQAWMDCMQQQNIPKCAIIQCYNFLRSHFAQGPGSLPSFSYAEKAMLQASPVVPKAYVMCPNDCTMASATSLDDLQHPAATAAHKKELQDLLDSVKKCTVCGSSFVDEKKRFVKVRERPTSAAESDRDAATTAPAAN